MAEKMYPGCFKPVLRRFPAGPRPPKKKKKAPHKQLQSCKNVACVAEKQPCHLLADYKLVLPTDSLLRAL